MNPCILLDWYRQKSRKSFLKVSFYALWTDPIMTKVTLCDKTNLCQSSLPYLNLSCTLIGILEVLSQLSVTGNISKEKFEGSSWTNLTQFHMWLAELNCLKNDRAIWFFQIIKDLLHNRGGGSKERSSGCMCHLVGRVQASSWMRQGKQASDMVKPRS